MIQRFIRSVAFCLLRRSGHVVIARADCWQVENRRTYSGVAK